MIPSGVALITTTTTTTKSQIKKQNIAFKIQILQRTLHMTLAKMSTLAHTQLYSHKQTHTPSILATLF